MNTQKTFVWLSVIAGLLTIVVSLLGIADSGTYGKETLNWAAQAQGQDYVNIAVVIPILLISSLLILLRNSFRALLVWLGALIYLIYSYILYAFFIHFGPLFLLYVAILGLSFFSFAGGLATVDRDEACKLFRGAKTKSAGVLLCVVAVLFSLLWLRDIIGALMRGGTPADLAMTGLWVNPIHVLDLSFLLPGAITVGVLVLRNRPLGLILALLYLVFFILMGLAIISMMIVTSHKGFELALPQVVVMGAIIIAGLTVATGQIRSIR